MTRHAITAVRAAAFKPLLPMIQRPRMAPTPTNRRSRAVIPLVQVKDLLVHIATTKPRSCNVFSSQTIIW